MNTNVEGKMRAKTFTPMEIWMFRCDSQGNLENDVVLEYPR